MEVYLKAMKDLTDFWLSDNSWEDEFLPIDIKQDRNRLKLQLKKLQELSEKTELLSEPGKLKLELAIYQLSSDIRIKASESLVKAEEVWKEKARRSLYISVLKSGVAKLSEQLKNDCFKFGATRNKLDKFDFEQYDKLISEISAPKLDKEQTRDISDLETAYRQNLQDEESKIRNFINYHNDVFSRASQRNSFFARESEFRKSIESQLEQAHESNQFIYSLLK